MRRTIIVSNRLPVSIKKTSDGIEVFKSSGGLVSAMESFTKKSGTTWIGWPGIVSDGLTEAEKEVITQKLKTLHCLPVFLTQKQVDEYYSGYSNAILWPLFHHLPAVFDHESKFWSSYRQVNQLFTDVITTVSTRESNVWIHDYQLMLVPQMLRETTLFERIGFFLHIPFPDVKHIQQLKNHRALANGLLGADLVGFHTPDYAREFMNLCEELNIGNASEDTIDLGSRAVHITDFPIGIDYKKFESGSKQRSVRKRVKQLRHTYKGRRIIVTVDRLDPTKGFVERLKAYDTFLDENPELHGEVVMMMLAIPSRGDVKAYQVLREKVEKLVEKINRTYGDKHWQPVDYMHKSVDFEELSAMYSVADVAFVAPIKDGMNLVAKEYVASQSRKDGMLILSETAGAAHELKDALLVNPKKPKTLVNALEQALTMPPRELKRSVKKMQSVVAENTNKIWADTFMTALHATDELVHTRNLTKTRALNIQDNYISASRRLLVFDYDGVLSGFHNNPDDAKPSKEVYKKLKELSSDAKNDVAVVSGRSRKDLEKWFGDLPIILGSEHGSVIRFNKSWKSTDDIDDTWKNLLKPVLAKYAKQAPGAFVEEKQNSLVWHYRAVSPYHAQKSMTAMRSALRPILKSLGIKMYMGNKILEFKHHAINKGVAVKNMLARKPYDFVFIIGDDYTDEDMFLVAPKIAFTVKVGAGRSAAKYRISSQPRVLSFLRLL